MFRTIPGMAYQESRTIFPYFQPIVSADTGKIYSYEALGRYSGEDGQVCSLGSFFEDAATTHEDALRVDRRIRRLAMEQFARESSGELLFINIRLQWISHYVNDLKNLPTLAWAKELAVAPEQLVIEITEDEFNGGDESYLNVLRYYKENGCKIAIDDYGKGASNIDRLAQIRPDIMKIDMDCVHRAEDSFHHHEYLKSIAIFAESVGIEVLYEGIETRRQLEICLDSQGKYYQGYLLSRPGPSIAAMRADRALFSEIFESVITKFKKKVIDSNHLRDWLETNLNRYIAEHPPAEAADMDDYLAALLRTLPKTVKRIFLCNWQGAQISYNVERRERGIKFLDYRGKNWAWRGYYQKALAVHESGRRSCITDLYRDMITKELIFTFSYLDFLDSLLFIDIQDA
ncbi:MAG: EAL domain-containing protein [Treponema sp.]|jgi:EAL domain-containing protein (putative c-di-GMP-specific phosphodiesterase class I)|nr:EAL domain-containing protein [Treponema sp.]